MTSVPLNRMAEVMKVHPRTILRYLHSDRNYAWDDMENPEVGVESVAEAFECDPKTLSSALAGTDELIKPADAAKEVGVIHMRSFWKQNHKPAIRIGRVTRYSRLTIAEWIVTNRM